MDPDRKGISGPHARMSLFATAVVIGHPDRVVSHHAADVHHFDGGAALAVAAASVSSSCTFTCTPFAQTYLVSRAEPGSGPVSFSARPMGPGSTFAGDRRERLLCG